jgi:predicted GNAT family acetyltransferase
MEREELPEVRNNPEEARFEAEVGGRRALLTYERADGEIRMLHTEVPGEHQGRGVGSHLVRAALEHARAEGLRVVPLCPFVRAYLERHPEYVPLVR